MGSHIKESLFSDSSELYVYFNKLIQTKEVVVELKYCFINAHWRTVIETNAKTVW